jgi:hypothetical protein
MQGVLYRDAVDEAAQRRDAGSATCAGGAECQTMNSARVVQRDSSVRSHSLRRPEALGTRTSHPHAVMAAIPNSMNHVTPRAADLEVMELSEV